MDSTVTIGGLFLEGLLSFFSPCVLPLIPLYIGYLTSGTEDEENPTKRRIHVMVLTISFVLGICTVFFLAGLGTNAFRTFLNEETLWLQLGGGIVLILFGLFALGWIRIPFLEKERRHFLKLGEKMTIPKAYLMGFFFSFAWSPCIGPLLASVLFVAANASSGLLTWAYILSYTLGFIFVFLLLGLFTDEILHLLKKHRNIVKYTKILGGLVVVGMGIYMLSQGVIAVNALKNNQPVAVQNEVQPDAQTQIEQYNFTLPSSRGSQATLSDHKGKTVVLSFFGTWCTFCNQELPHLQEIEENNPDVKIFLITTPNVGREGDITYIENYLKEKGVTIETLYDTQLQVTRMYQISGYPTTFIIKRDGDFYGYVPGYVDKETMETFLQEAMAYEE